MIYRAQVRMPENDEGKLLSLANEKQSIMFTYDNNIYGSPRNLSAPQEYINMHVLWCPKKMQKQSFIGMSLQQVSPCLHDNHCFNELATGKSIK